MNLDPLDEELDDAGLLVSGLSWEQDSINDGFPMLPESSFFAISSPWAQTPAAARVDRAA